MENIIKCKDCFFYEEAHYEEEGEKPYIKYVCRLFQRQMQEDDFCSLAELKNE